MDRNQRNDHVKKIVLLSIIVLTGILFALVANLVRMRQISVRSRATSPKTIPVPTLPIPLVVTACGRTKINCNQLKPNIRQSVTSSIIPADKPGDVTNMECVLAQHKMDAECAYKAKNTQPSCLTGAAFISVGVANTTSRCMAVKYDKTQNPAMCRITELFLPNGQIPPKSTDCLNILITPTGLPNTKQ